MGGGGGLGVGFRCALDNDGGDHMTRRHKKRKCSLGAAVKCKQYGRNNFIDNECLLKGSVLYTDLP